MKYYKLDWKSDNLGRVHSAVFGEDDTSVEDALRRDENVSQGHCKLVSPRAELCNFVRSISQEMIVDSDLHSILQNFQIGEGIKIVPVTIDNLESFYLYYPTQKPVIIDRNLAEYTEIDGYVFDVKKWVVDMKVLPAKDFFCSSPTQWIISEKLVNQLMESDISGVTFTPLQLNR